MSRIYEALQRADRERMATPLSDGNRADGSAVIPEFDEPSIGVAIAFEDIVPQPWQVSLTAFPSLADHGLGIEQFRSLRSRLYQARYETPLKTILISSGSPSEGKSFVAANLAVSFARNGANRVLLIDGDLRRSTLHRLFGAPNTQGLSDYLSGTVDLDAVLQREDTPGQTTRGAAALANLALISAGTVGNSSPELVTNRRFDELIAAASPYFDWIVIDSPPVLAVTDAVELARAADAVLLVARWGRTSFEVIQRTQAVFSKSRILGFVLNDAKEAQRSASQYDYYYYGGPEAEKQVKSRKSRRRQK